MKTKQLGGNKGSYLELTKKSIFHEYFWFWVFWYPWHTSFSDIQNFDPIFRFRNIWIFEKFKSQSEGFRKYLDSEYLEFLEISIIRKGFKKYLDSEIFDWVKNLNLRDWKNYETQKSRNIWIFEKFKSQSEGFRKYLDSEYLEFLEISIIRKGFKKYLDSEIFDWVKNLNLRDSKNYEIQKSLTESKILNLANCRFKKYLNSEIFDGVQFQNLRHSKNIGTQKFLTESKISWSIWGIQKIFGPRNSWVSQKFSIWLKTFFQKTKIIWCERAAK